MGRDRKNADVVDVECESSSGVHRGIMQGPAQKWLLVPGIRGGLPALYGWEPEQAQRGSSLSKITPQVVALGVKSPVCLQSW